MTRYLCLPLITLMLIAHQPVHSEIRNVYAVAWSTDGQTIVIVSSATYDAGSVPLSSVWYGRAFATGKLQTTADSVQFYTSGEKKLGTLQTGNAGPVAISPNNRYLAAGTSDGTIDIRDAVPQQLKFTPAGNTGPPHPLL